MHLIMDVISTGFRGPAPIRTTQNPFSIKIALKMDTTLRSFLQLMTDIMQLVSLMMEN